MGRSDSRRPRDCFPWGHDAWIHKDDEGTVMTTDEAIERYGLIVGYPVGADDGQHTPRGRTVSSPAPKENA